MSKVSKSNLKKVEVDLNLNDENNDDLNEALISNNVNSNENEEEDLKKTNNHEDFEKENDFDDNHNLIVSNNKISIDKYNIKKEKEKFSIKSVSKILLQENSLIVLSSVTVSILHLFNLILLNHTDSDLIFTTVYQVGIIYLNLLGFNFLRGSLDTFRSSGSITVRTNNKEKLIEFYHEIRIFAILFFLITIFPLSFVSNYVLSIFGLDENTLILASSFTKIYAICSLFEVFSEINNIFLGFQNQKYIVFAINLTTMFIHIISCIMALFYFRFGVVGIGVACCISSLFKLICTQTSVYFFNPIPEKNVINIETDVLNSSNFFYFFKNAIALGFTYTMKYLYFELFGIINLFINKEAFIASILMMNLISFLFYVVRSVTDNFEKFFSNHSIKSIYNIDSEELDEFLNEKIEFSKYFNKKGKNSFETLCLMRNEAKYEKHITTLEKHFQEINLVRIYALINYLVIFCMILCAVTSLVLFLFKKWIINVFVEEGWVQAKFEQLINYYCVIIFFDWIGQVYNSINSAFGSVVVLTIIRSLFGIIIFLPLGAMMSYTLGIGIKGFWYSFYLYIIMFAVVNTVHFNKLDLKYQCDQIRKRFNTNLEKRIDEIEIYYKLNN